MMPAAIKNEMSACILAGGKSTRMGEDKGLILLNGKPMIQYVIVQLKLMFENIFIVTNNAEYKKFGVECIEDAIQNIGPAGGIFSALKHSYTPFNFIVSCDMPFIHMQGIEYIMMNSLKHQITIPVFETRFQPLCGVYHKNIVDEWHKHILLGERKLQSMAEHFLLKKLEVDSHPFFGKNFFKNINTPGELGVAENYFF